MKIDVKAVAATLNKIMEYELAGTVRYTHYSLMTYGYNRIPIVSWLRGQATESLDHATQAGELITQLGEHPSLAMGPLLETHKHDIGDILRESMQHERDALAHYYTLLEQVEGKSVQIEEYAREMIRTEEQHLGEVDKMLRKPGDIGKAGGLRGLSDRPTARWESDRISPVTSGAAAPANRPDGHGGSSGKRGTRPQGKREFPRAASNRAPDEVAA